MFLYVNLFSQQQEVSGTLRSIEAKIPVFSSRFHIEQQTNVRVARATEKYSVLTALKYTSITLYRIFVLAWRSPVMNSQFDDNAGTILQPLKSIIAP